MKANQVFPVRLLGFGLYWAWLFLVTLSPSQLFGSLVFFDVPFELVELGFRLAFIGAFLLLSAGISTNRGRNALVAISCLGGPLATGLIYYFSATPVMWVAVACAGLVDASIFVLWLCFFGHLKVGETALYMTLSYCIGGVICLLVQLLVNETAVLVSMFLPAISGLMFHFSNRYYSSETGIAELFSEDDMASVESTKEDQYPYLTRLSVALACCAFAFGVTASNLFFGGITSVVSGSLVESVCCVVLAVVCGGTMFYTKQTTDLCLLYKVAPVVLTLGAVVLLSGASGLSTVGVGLMQLGYLMFEITALNDYCIAAKQRGLRLVGTICCARISITGGMLLGWIIGYAASRGAFIDPAFFTMSVVLVVVAVYPNFVFTAKEIFAARTTAVAQEAIERDEDKLESARDSFNSVLSRMAKEYKLSAREQEIADFILHGRTVNYISKQLFIAPGTVKTHMHNMYSKVGVHSKMELLDVFDEFKSKQEQ